MLLWKSEWGISSKKECQKVKVILVYLKSDVGSNEEDGGCKQYEASP
jgi:hypothetical protein